MHFLKDSVIGPPSSISFLRFDEEAVGFEEDFLLRGLVSTAFFDDKDFESEDGVKAGLLLVRRIVFVDTVFPLLVTGSASLVNGSDFEVWDAPAPLGIELLRVKVIPPDPLPDPNVEVASPVPAEALKAAIPGALAPTKFGSAIKFEESPK